MFNLLNVLLVFSGWALIILRIVIGLIFVFHTAPKLKGLKANKKTLAAALGTIGGLFLILGVWVQIIALVFAIGTLIVVLWKVKKGHKFVGGYEFELILLAAMLVLATMGGGVLSGWLGF